MITTLVQNVALLIALVVVYHLIIRKWTGGGWEAKVMSGLLFGAVGVVSMATPFVFAEGVVVDGRSIILAVAGFFGGPVVALIAAVICAVYRLSMGGAGAWVGVAVISSSAILGVIGYCARRRHSWVIHWAGLWGFGLVVHLVMIAWLSQVPGVGADLARGTGGVVIVLFPLATMVVCLIFLDRERRHLTERMLHESEERNRTTLMSIGDAVISTDAEGCVSLMNEVAEKLTGWSLEEARGLPLDSVFIIVSETDRRPAENPAHKVMAEGKTVGLANHTLLISRNGTEWPIADSAAPILDSGGHLIGVVLVFRDQTAERAAQNALEESERRMAGLLSHLPGMVYRCRNNHEWTGEFVSQGCFDLTGLTAEEICAVGKNGFAELIHPEDRERVWEETQAAIRDNRSFLTAYRIVTPGGKLKWVEGRGKSLPDPVGGEALVEGFIIDVTEREEAEIERKRLEEQLRHAHKMEAVGRLAGGVAHDFNNMLSVINLYTEMALDELQADASSREYLKAVKQAGQRSAELTRQLLAFARKQPIAPQTLDVNRTMEGMLSMLKRLIGENIRVEWRPGADLQAVRMDPAQLDQVLVNLVINARDAIGSTGEIILSTRPFTLGGTKQPPVREMPPGQYVEIVVRDNGRGMDQETADHVFEPFFTTKTTGQGTGLGLATVYGVVSQNRGFVTVASQIGKGTEFRLFFPAHKPIAAPLVPKVAEARPLNGRETILLVEDEEAILKLSRIILEKLGYTVLCAKSPEEALRQAKTAQVGIDLLVTDVIMPEMNGHDLWREINGKQKVRCLFISGYTADIIQNQGILFENVHFLQKPFTVDALAAKVREALAAPVSEEPM